MAAREPIQSGWSRAKALLRRTELERDLDDELRFHLAMRAAEYEAQGIPTPEARRAAARRFGNPVVLKEECRDMWSFRHLETFVQDVRFAVRLLWKSPAFTAVAVLSLAIGIGGNAAMFSLVSAILLRPLPYPAAEQLVRLTGYYPKGAVVALQDQSRTMEVAGVGADVELNLTGQGQATRLVGSTVSANLFSVLGRSAELGRTFEVGDDHPGRDHVVLLSHALWQGRFRSDPSTVGRTITVEGVDRLVVGAVTPGYFRVMRIPLAQGRVFDDSDGERTTPVVVVSAATAKRYWPDENPIGKRIRVVWDRDWRTVVGVVGDVRQYALSGSAPVEITGAVYMPYPQSVALNREIPRSLALFVRSSVDPSNLAARLRTLVESVNPDVPVSEVRSLEAVVSSAASEPRSMMWLFASFAGSALLLAAIGTYGVVSYSTAQRTHEIGVRVAIGATRRDILALVMGQSLRLVLVGLALGIGAALVLARTLSGFLYGVSPGDPVTFAAVVGLLILTALVAGYVPGRRAAATDPVRALRAD